MVDPLWSLLTDHELQICSILWHYRQDRLKCFDEVGTNPVLLRTFVKAVYQKDNLGRELTPTSWSWPAVVM